MPLLRTLVGARVTNAILNDCRHSDRIASKYHSRFDAHTTAIGAYEKALKLPRMSAPNLIQSNEISSNKIGVVLLLLAVTTPGGSGLPSSLSLAFAKTASKDGVQMLKKPSICESARVGDHPYVSKFEIQTANDYE